MLAVFSRKKRPIRPLRCTAVAIVVHRSIRCCRADARSPIVTSVHTTPFPMQLTQRSKETFGTDTVL